MHLYFISVLELVVNTVLLNACCSMKSELRTIISIFYKDIVGRVRITWSSLHIIIYMNF